MKKYFMTYLLACMALPVLANDTIYPDPAGLTTALQKANQQAVQTSTAKPASAGAHEKGVIKIQLNVEAQFEEEYARTNHLTKYCTAVRIAPNYLLASLACRGTSKTAMQQHYRGKSAAPEYEEMPVAYRKINSIFIGNHQVTSFKEDAASKLILIKVDEQNEFNWFADLPITNLFVAKDPHVLEDLFDEVILNREKSMWFGRTCDTAEVSAVCSDTSCFKVCWKWHAAKTGDPIFGLNNQKPSQEFLLGFNDAEPNGEQRTEGRFFRFFSQKTINFLKKNVDNATWKKIQKKTVSEDFFK